MKNETIQDLRGELERLERLIKNATQRITAIRLILGASSQSTEIVDIHEQQRSSSSVSPDGQTFAAQIRSALGSVRPARAKDVAEVLQNWGHHEEGLSSRVSVELYRMAERNTGGVIRVDRGLYDIRVVDE